MSNHLSLRSGNPVLKANTFIQRHTAIDNGTMTITGTVNKTALGLLLLMTTAIFTWNMTPNDPRVGGLMMVGIFGGLILKYAFGGDPLLSIYLAGVLMIFGAISTFFVKDKL